MTNTIFEKDLYRFYGKRKETLRDRLLRPVELKYLSVLRKQQSCHNAIMELYYKIRLRHLSTKTQIQIPAKTQIGEGFYIGHTGRIIINYRTVIGRNVNISTGVTIGQENRGGEKGHRSSEITVRLGQMP